MRVSVCLLVITCSTIRLSSCQNCIHESQPAKCDQTVGEQRLDGGARPGGVRAGERDCDQLARRHGPFDRERSELGRAVAARHGTQRTDVHAERCRWPQSAARIVAAGLLAGWLDEMDRVCHYRWPGYDGNVAARA